LGARFRFLDWVPSSRPRPLRSRPSPHRLDQAIEAQGQDFPGEKCIRNDGEESSTSGKCENVCKDKEVYSPHPSEDPAGTFGVCKGEAKKKE